MSKGFKSPVVPLAVDSVLYAHSTEKMEPASTMAGVITADMSSAAASGVPDSARQQRAVATTKEEDAGNSGFLRLLRLRVVGRGEVDCCCSTCRLRTVDGGRGDAGLARRRCNGGGVVCEHIFGATRKGIRYVGGTSDDEFIIIIASYIYSEVFSTTHTAHSSTHHTAAAAVVKTRQDKSSLAPPKYILVADRCSRDCQLALATTIIHGSYTVCQLLIEIRQGQHQHQQKHAHLLHRS